MPDWCDTRMTIEGPKDQVENIRKMILQWTSKNYAKNDFGHGWLGNIVLGAGFSYKGKNKLSCRGSITEIGEVEEKGPRLHYFELYYISAWGRCIRNMANYLRKICTKLQDVLLR